MVRTALGYGRASDRSANAAGPNAPTAALPGATSALVANEDAKRAAASAVYGDQQGTALGALKATGETLNDANVTRSRAAQDVALQNSFKVALQNQEGSALDAANQQGAGYRALGDLLKGSGSLAISAGIKDLYSPRLPVNILPTVAQFTPSAIGTIETPNAMTSASALGSAFSMY